MRSLLDFVPAVARDRRRLWTVIYVAGQIALFSLAFGRRFSLPLTPILDADSPNFLWPALLKLNGHDFIHNAGLNFAYPGFLLFLLRSFSDFRAIVVVQHLLGLAGGFFFLHGWNRLHDLDFATRLRRPVHQALGLFGAGIYLLSPTPMLFENQIRPEALCMAVQLMSFWLLFEFLFYRRKPAQAGRMALFGCGAIASSLLLCALKPSFTGAALFTAALVLVLVICSRHTWRFRAFFCSAALLIALAFFVPERWLARNDRLSKMFLPQTLFAVHANIIHAQMKEDLARGVATPFPTAWLRTACDELGAEIERLHVPYPKQFSLLGFDPDHLMNGDQAIMTRWLRQLGGDDELKRFLNYYFWRAFRQRPLDFTAKISRQLAVFYDWQCPAFISHRRIALTAWYYQPSMAVIRDPENWEQLGAVPGGPPLLAQTEEIATQDRIFDSGKRPFFYHSILARTYLPLLAIGVGVALGFVFFGKAAAGEKWPSLLVPFFFLVNLGNVLAVSAVHSMEVLRYSTVLFATALFAQLWAIRYLLEFLLRKVPVRSRLV